MFFAFVEVSFKFIMILEFRKIYDTAWIPLGLEEPIYTTPIFSICQAC